MNKWESYALLGYYYSGKKIFYTKECFMCSVRTFYKKKQNIIFLALVLPCDV